MDCSAACGVYSSVRLAIATSADRVKLDGNLREIRVERDTFNATVNGAEVARKKPFPDIFLKAAERLRTESAHCLVVEDAVTGIQAAVSAGMRALGLTTSFAADVLMQAGATWTAPNLAHVPVDIIELMDGSGQPR